MMMINEDQRREGHQEILHLSYTFYLCYLVKSPPPFQLSCIEGLNYQCVGVPVILVDFLQNKFVLNNQCTSVTCLFTVCLICTSCLSLAICLHHGGGDTVAVTFCTFFAFPANPFIYFLMFFNATTQGFRAEFPFQLAPLWCSDANHKHQWFK